jgi:hypothetical protein
MRKLAVIAALFLATSANAGPLDFIKHHKRFLFMEGAAIAGASIHAYGLHHCRRLNGVEPCDENYGAAWAGFGVSTGFTTIVFPAIAEGCWKSFDSVSSTRDGGKFCNIFGYTPSAVQASWGIHEATIHVQKTDTASFAVRH